MAANLKSSIRQNWFFYLLGTAIILTLKLFYRNAGPDELKWILTPTARWVSILSGIDFQYEPQLGYVSHSFQFIIATSCSGVQFMLVCIAVLLFSHLHRLGTKKSSLCWFIASIAASWVYTVFINGFRITASIYLPLALGKTGILGGWLTPERLHTAIGTAVYFMGLLALYRAAGYASLKIAGIYSAVSPPTGIQKYLSPVLWYFGIVLGIPFLNRAVRRDWGNFGEYALLVTTLCLVFLFLIFFLTLLQKLVRKKT